MAHCAPAGGRLRHEQGPIRAAAGTVDRSLLGL